ncbi:MAG: hypothetical protein ACK5NE_08075 [Brachymonas sp.]
MYDVSNGYRFRLVCLLLGLFLAGPSLAATLYSPYAFPAELYVDPVEAAQRDLCNYWSPALCPKYRLGANPSDISNTGASISYKTYRVSDGLLMGYSAKVYIRTGKECPAGYEEKNGQCVVPKNECEEKAGQEAGAGLMMFDVSQQYIDQWSIDYLNTGKKTATSCHQGCVATGNQQMSGCNGSGADKKCFMVIDKTKYSGASCKSENKPADTPPATTPEGGASAPSWSDSKPFTCDVGKCPGVVNGAQVCMKCDQLSTGSDSSNSTSSSSTSASGATSSDGSNTSSTSTTTCDETTGKCTTTTTTTKTNSDGSSSSSTSTDTESKGQYCVKNPWDTKQCGGKGNGDADDGRRMLAMAQARKKQMTAINKRRNAAQKVDDLDDRMALLEEIDRDSSRINSDYLLGTAE